MDTMWEKIKKNLKDGAAMSVEKIEEYTKIGKLKVEEMSAKRKIERNYVDAGERVYELIQEGKGSEIAEDLVVRKSVENIAALKEELVQIDMKITEITEAAKKEPDEEDEVNSI